MPDAHSASSEPTQDEPLRGGGGGAATESAAEAEGDDCLDQKSRALRIKTPLDDDPHEKVTVILTRFSGAETLSRPFRFELELLSLKDSKVAFEDLLGQSVTVTAEVPNMPSRSWNGVITSFSQTSRDDNYCFYSAVLEPSTYALAMRTNCRVFQAQKVDEILDTLLEGFTVKKSYTQADNRQPRNYCVQYRETDFTFLSRLIEEYGLNYYFEHQGDAHTLVLCDDSTQLAKIDGLDPVDYKDINEGDSTVKSWVKTQRLTPTAVKLGDRHYQHADESYDGDGKLPATTAVGDQTHKFNPLDATFELYDFPGGYAHRYDALAKEALEVDPEKLAETPLKNIADDAAAEATLQAQLIANQAVQISGTSDVLQFYAGGVFTLNGHFSADGDYLILSVMHTVKLGVGVSSSQTDDTLSYQNTFACQPSSLAYRAPRVTPRPVIHGVQTARVVADIAANAAKDDRREQLIDCYGRVKVRFPWDRRPDAPAEDDAAAEQAPAGADDPPADGGEQLDKPETAQPADRSCWVRVAQIWAGNNWGAFFWPRHNHEVLVAFEHGDPDRPVIVGSLYNSENMPPMKLPTNSVLGGIKSCSVNGNPAKDSSSIVFYDKLGQEHLNLHSEKHTISVTEESHHEFVAGPSVRVFGGISRLFGSGAGGGPIPEANPTGIKTPITKKYRNLGLAKNFESDISVTLGNAASIVGGLPCGTSNEVVFGGKLDICIDPLGWLPEGKINALQNLLMPTGQWSGLFGEGRALHYGPATNIRHGSEIDRRSKKTFDNANPRSALVSGIVTASVALTSLGFASQTNNPVIWENLVRTLGPRGISGALLNLLIELEKANGETDAGAEKQDEASSLSDHAGALGSDYASLILSLAQNATDAGSTLAAAGTADASAQQSQSDSEDNSVDDAEDEDEEDDQDDSGGDDDQDADAAADSDSSDEDDSPSADDITFGSDDADVYQCYDGLLSTGARHITFRARASDDSDTDPSLIHLDAHGADGEDNGVVAINSTGQATIVCGPASVQVRRDSDTGQVDISTGDQGTLTLSVGPAGSGSQIVMTPDGIKLSVGGDGGPCLELTTSGVKMSCGSNSVAVDESGQTTAGMNISHSADNSFEAKGTMVSVQGTGQTTVKGSVTMIN
ncbi:Phage-related baseplate assembly protein [Posidoniimonas polymericola]|uniref:Phage-related baseplate assembly protein n=1 Tax=Posidoniimonas polymericola TaxID=2528002 RepID=A0A5C5YL56_9BACT|nr:type VI secretion system tip protein TssI/VgrG [Posidoniimonas polymericola]TWT75591.1 Phage-related baseplate assembly protein [Posidoniimonas polymericola]